jgi:hypothetical protein
MYITIHGAVPASYDFSFALKKSIVLPNVPTTFVIPPQVYLLSILLSIQKSMKDIYCPSFLLSACF